MGTTKIKKLLEKGAFLFLLPGKKLKYLKKTRHYIILITLAGQALTTSLVNCFSISGTPRMNNFLIQEALSNTALPSFLLIRHNAGCSS
jgi:hypothetical protein